MGGVHTLNEVKCSECGKVFIEPPLNIYKINNRTFCSYTCWRKNGGGRTKSVISISEDSDKLKKRNNKIERIVKDLRE